MLLARRLVLAWLLAAAAGGKRLYLLVSLDDEQLRGYQSRFGKPTSVSIGR